MKFPESFETDSENDLATDFLTDGYVLADAEDLELLTALRQHIVEISSALLELPVPEESDEFLRQIHTQLPIEKLNDFRLQLYNRMNTNRWFRPTYFALAQTVIDHLVGNELAMQNQINFSVQMPEDASSLIPIHSDSFSGETPFQIVVWVPLISTYGRNSMFILPPEHNRRFFPELKSLSEAGGMNAVFDAVEGHLKWIEVPFGKFLAFSPNLLHGNVVNDTNDTRWSMNSRFTGLFTPYASAGKSLGTFYLPITTRPVSRIGMHYRAPTGFDEVS